MAFLGIWSIEKSRCYLGLDQFCCNLVGSNGMLVLWRNCGF